MIGFGEIIQDENQKGKEQIFKNFANIPDDFHPGLKIIATGNNQAVVSWQAFPSPLGVQLRRW